MNVLYPCQLLFSARTTVSNINTVPDHYHTHDGSVRVYHAILNEYLGGWGGPLLQIQYFVKSSPHKK